MDNWKIIDVVKEISQGDIVVKTNTAINALSTPTPFDEFYKIEAVVEDEVILNMLNYNEISETMKFNKIQTTIDLTQLTNGYWYKKINH